MARLGVLTLELEFKHGARIIVKPAHEMRIVLIGYFKLINRFENSHEVIFAELAEGVDNMRCKCLDWLAGFDFAIQQPQRVLGEAPLAILTHQRPL